MVVDWLRLTLLAGAVSAAATAAARGAEFCVTCEGPPAQYACQFDATQASLNDSPLKLLCITELAKSGPHASCSVDRAQTPPCAGQVRHLALPEGFEAATPESGLAAPPPGDAQPVASPSGGQPAAAAPGQQGAPQTEPTAPSLSRDTDRAGAAPAEEGPPKTVKDMVTKGAKSTGEALEKTGEALEKTGEAASDAAKKTGSALENAGAAVGNAAQKTWKCLTSLFGDC